MINLQSQHERPCPYRDELKIPASNGRISWFQLLDVPVDVSDKQLERQWMCMRSRAAKKRELSDRPIWTTVLDTIDFAYHQLASEKSRHDYAKKVAGHHVEVSSKPAKKRRTRKIATPRERFEPLGLIGKGVRGTSVFEAYEFGLKRMVAVKCLSKSAKTERRRESFLAEARHLATMTHPNIVEVHSVESRKCFYVMELLPKQLQQSFVVDRYEAVNPRDVCEFLRQALPAIGFLHNQNLIHGALKPSSFLVSDNNTIKLVDGCSKPGFFRAPDPGQKCVAPELISPDIFGAPTAAVDLYMLGFVAFQLLAGNRIEKWVPRASRPGGDDSDRWGHWHASPKVALPDLREVLPGVSDRLADVIEKMCRKRVSERYQLAGDVLNDLESHSPNSLIDEKRPAFSHHVSAASVGLSQTQTPTNSSSTSAVVAEQNGQFELLELLQEPQLMWQVVSQYRFAKPIAAAAAILMFAVLFGDSGQPNVEVPRDSQQSTAMAERQTQQPVPEYTELDPDDFGTKQVRPDDPEVAASLVVSMTQGSDYEELEPIENFEFVVKRENPVGQDLPYHQPVANKAITGALPVISPFPVSPSATLQQNKGFHRLLSQLSFAHGFASRKKAYQLAAAIAPKDPRPHFAYSAIFNFSGFGREPLEQAVKLENESDLQYMQARRVYIEQKLRKFFYPRRRPDRSSGPEEIADSSYLSFASSEHVDSEEVSTLLAGKKHTDTDGDVLSQVSRTQLRRQLDTLNTELLRFVRSLNSQEVTTRRIRLEWVGRVVGYLERIANSDAPCRQQMKHRLDMLIAECPAANRAHLQSGREWSHSHTSRHLYAEDFFPLQPKLEATLCIESVLLPTSREFQSDRNQPDFDQVSPAKGHIND